MPTKTVNTETRLSVYVGREFVIIQPANPAAGYRWEASFERGDVEPRGSEYIAPRGAKAEEGGFQILRFVVNTDGEHQIQLRYVREFSPEAKKIADYTIVATMELKSE